MSIKLSLAIILIILTAVLTHLFDTNGTAEAYMAKLGHKIGVNTGNYVTGTKTCPEDWVCVSPTP